MQKTSIVAEIDVGGATLSEVARRHGIHSSLLFRWRRTHGSVMGAPPIDTSPPPRPPTPPSFMPVMLPLSPSAATAPKVAATIEVVLAGGRTVRVGGDVDTAALVRIVEALEQQAGGLREKRR